MIDWLIRRVFTVADVGRWHARRGYPRADNFVMLPLYGLVEPIDEPADMPDIEQAADLPSLEADVTAAEPVPAAAPLLFAS